MATDIVINSKCHRPGVCNAAETLLIHKDAAKHFWPALAAELQSQGVALRCCARSAAGVAGAAAATDEDYATEYLDLILSVRIVDSVEDAADSHSKVRFSSYGIDCHSESCGRRVLPESRRFGRSHDQRQHPL